MNSRRLDPARACEQIPSKKSPAPGSEADGLAHLAEHLDIFANARAGRYVGNPERTTIASTDPSTAELRNIQRQLIIASDELAAQYLQLGEVSACPMQSESAIRRALHTTTLQVARALSVSIDLLAAAKRIEAAK